MPSPARRNPALRRQQPKTDGFFFYLMRYTSSGCVQIVRAEREVTPDTGAPDLSLPVRLCVRQTPNVLASASRCPGWKGIGWSLLLLLSLADPSPPTALHPCVPPPPHSFTPLLPS
ncbi:hypothetical protein NDU88_002594 [Pleurodeles waltl]|uniref:Uncharacterized protein n=1 Tax=Pleurodeles waltl TaxID=8319 RepID=A0AAV7WLP2_PLEWA|nr:hypothetical protein NDU88_002594 [Pleurodeles waltl]